MQYEAWLDCSVGKKDGRRADWLERLAADETPRSRRNLPSLKLRPSPEAAAVAPRRTRAPRVVARAHV